MNAIHSPLHPFPKIGSISPKLILFAVFTNMVPLFLLLGLISSTFAFMVCRYSRENTVLSNRQMRFTSSQSKGLSMRIGVCLPNPIRSNDS